MSQDGHDPECESRQAVSHYDGSAYCASCGGRLADVSHDFEPGFHDDECTHSGDGTWATYCGAPRSVHLT